MHFSQSFRHILTMTNKAKNYFVLVTQMKYVCGLISSKQAINLLKKPAWLILRWLTSVVTLPFN